MTDLFSSPTPTTNTESNIDPNKNYLEELVGDGKKFKTVEDLAKSKLESDRFIEQLKAEAAGLRQDLNTRLTLEQMMDKISATPPQQTPNPNANGTTPGSDGNGNGAKQPLTEEDIAALVEQRLSQAEKLRIQEANVNQVKQALTERFGPDYANHLKQTATALGVGEEFLNGLAKEQPKAFLALIDREAPAQQKKPVDTGLFAPTPSHQVPRAPGFTPTGDRKKSYYDALKQKDLGTYWSPSVQNQMHQDALRLGEAFFDT